MLKKKGVDSVIFSPKNFGFKFYGDILFTSEKELFKHPNRVKKFTGASLKGWNYAFENIEEAVELILKKYNIQNKSKDELYYEANELKKLAFYDTNKLGDIDPDNISRIFDIYKVLGLTQNELDIENFVYKKDEVKLSKEEKIFLNKLSTIKVHNEMNWPPYNFVDLENPKGYSIDIMNLLSKKLGINVEYVSGYSWDEFLELIKNKQIDLMLNIVNNKQRREYLNFTTNYAEILPSIFVLKEENRFNKLADLKGKIVAVPKGFYTQELLERKYPNIKLHLTKDILEGLKLLMFKKVDAVISDYGVLTYIMEKNGISAIKAAAYIEDKEFRSPLNIGVRNDMPLLRNILQKGIEQITEEEFISLRRKWFGDLQNNNSKKIKLTKKEKKFLDNKKEILVCVESNRMPFSSYLNSKNIGIIPDYLKIFSEKINKPIKIIKTKSQLESYTFMNKNTCEVLPAVAISSTKLKDYHFTSEYLFTPLVIATKKDKSFISDISDLENKTVAIVEGSHYKEKILMYNSNVQIQIYKTMQDALKAVKIGDVFGVIGSLSVISYSINKHKLFNIKIAGKLKDNWNLRIASSNNIPELNSIFQKAINSLTIDEHDKIQNKWSSIRFEQGVDYSLLYKVVLPVVAVLIYIILYLWNVKLKRAIKKRKRISRELKNSLKNFEILVNSTIEALLILDEEHVCIDLNDAAVKLFKVKEKSELLGKNVFELVSYESIDSVKNNINLDINEPYEVILVKNDGTSFPALVKGQNSIRNNKTIRIASIIDLSELKQKDKMLQQQSSLAQMGEMISMIAHQWRQPLGAIAASAIAVKTKIDLESYDFKTKEGQEEHIEFLEDTFSKIELYVKNLSTTIDDFRNFYKPNKKKELIDVNKPIIQALNIIEVSIYSKGVEVDVNLNSTKKIEIYNSEMMQVILNLLKNAVDNFEEHNIKNPEISIRTYDLEDNIVIEVSDNGSGMSNEVINKIFEPYFSTKDSKNGTGLGLYMSKIIIEEHHNGKLSVECKNSNTRFTIVLK
jgi:PAS domain S-box-containing protein